MLERVSVHIHTAPPIDPNQAPDRAGAFVDQQTKIRQAGPGDYLSHLLRVQISIVVRYWVGFLKEA